MKKQQFKLWDNNPQIVLDAYLQQADDRLCPTMVICPGGAYFRIAENEAEPVALKWHALGFNTFVLRYSTVSTGGISWPNPMLDLGKAVDMIRSNANNWPVDKNKIIVCGFSAGGHLAISYGNRWREDFCTDRIGTTPDKLMPNAIIGCYPVIEYTILDEEWRNDPKSRNMHPLIGMTVQDLREKQYAALFGTHEPSCKQLQSLSNSQFINSHTPPTFLWHTLNDELVSAKSTLKYAEELSKKSIQFDLHIFMDGPHGLSLSDKTVSSTNVINSHVSNWVSLANSWLKSVNLGPVRDGADTQRKQ